MKTDPVSDATLQALADIRRNLGEKLNLLEDHIRGAQLMCLDDAFQKKAEALVDCLEGIDQQLINLSVYIEEYQHLETSLRDINEKISHFGGSARPMPETIAGESMASVLAGRLDYLQSQGKIRSR
jgi:hypothetical protein